MATAFDTDLPTRLIEASTRAVSASAELYTQVLTTQAEATRSMFEAFTALGTQGAASGAEATEQAADKVAETTTRTARTAARGTRSTARTAKRTTRRAAGATRRAAKPAAKAATQAPKAVTEAAKPVTEATQAAVAEPPFPGYDDLSSVDLVAKLPEQPQIVLARIAAYERAKEKRATVLQRVAALSGPEPARGYDELTAEEAQKLVTDGNADLAATVRDYERRHKDRASVVEAAAKRAEAA